MAPNLSPIEPLSQVVFIHDYLQLVFQDERFTIYNLASLVHREVELVQGSAGFCDGVVNLIGQRITQVEQAERSALSLLFEGGAWVHVLIIEGAVRGPEAFAFAGKDNLFVVEQNA